MEDSSRGALTAAGLSCGSCGSELPPNSKFCNECGAPVTQVSRSAEYKQVTVLFADVVHSMDIAAAVDAERLREIMADLADGCAAVVQRYGGTVDKFTGDGIMAVFGAPVALEDHAIRACIAALGVQEETKRLAVDVRDRDGVDLQLRVGLNSGQVIAGEIGSGSFGYTAVGEQVGLAQRLESVAPPGGVLLSESTARLVEHAAVLAEPEMARIRGADTPVHARLLLAAGEQQPRPRSESTLVGRTWELNSVTALLGEAIGSTGCVVNIAGAPGIGKSRVVREVAVMARRQGVEVFTTFCESHTDQVPFHAVSGLLRAAWGVDRLDARPARARIRAQASRAEPEDLLLFDDLLGIADPDVQLPQIAPDARRRRLTALVNAALLVRTQPALYVIEDVHWIDDVSESMLADFSTVIPQTPSLVLITYRPEYGGALSRVSGAQTIALRPLSDGQACALTAELLGVDPSTAALAGLIATRAAGNPFFVEEMVRDLAERGAVQGQPGAYVLHRDVADVNVPATLQATIAARIDRLGSPAKHTLNAAAVIGTRFDTDLLSALVEKAEVAPLIEAELVDQVGFTPRAEYMFHHPLIRTVAYEAQLKSDRAELHRRVAAAIEANSPASVDENAALIAEHLEAAGDLHAAYRWHMRAATWATNRDIAAARLSWERARKIADAVPAEDPHRAAMRIAPRTMLCATAFRVHVDVAGFDELRELCTAAGDKASLAIGMVGLAPEHMICGRVREASRLASEHMALIESTGDPTLTVGLAVSPIAIKVETGEMAEVLRWSQTVIELTGGDPAKGNFIIGSPLTVALALRGAARWALGRAGWRDDYDRALAMARTTDPMSHALVITYTYVSAIPDRVLVADDTALRDIEEALHTAERSSEDLALGLARLTMGLALLHRDSPAEHERGLAVLAQVRNMCLHQRFFPFILPVIDVWAARQRARRGDRDGAIPLLRGAVDDLFHAGQIRSCSGATAYLVETLLERGANGDVTDAEAAIARLAAAPDDDGLVIREIWLLRLRALLAQARGDEAAYRDYRDRYRAMATSLGFEGHMKWAEAMP